MFIDIVGYTKKTASLSREKFDEMHDIFDSLSIPVFEKYGGSVVKKIGDAFLITFTSATDAVLCGIELQNSFRQYNRANKGNIPLQIRVAIHTGEVILRDNDVYGDAVNTAARIEGVAKADHIVFSETVFSAMNKSEIPYIHLGLRKMKGLRYPVRIFRVKSQYDKILKRRKRFKRRRQRMRNLLFSMAAFAFVILMIMLLLYLLGMM